MYTDELMDEVKIRKNLKLLDNLCQQDSIYASFLLIGGAALSLHLARNKKEIKTTRDIDISQLKFEGDQEKLTKYFGLLGISTSADGILFPPGEEILKDDEYYEFKDDYKNIKVYLVSPEMLITIKANTKRKKDLEDILNVDLLEIIDPQKTVDMLKEYESYNIFSNDPELNKHEILPKLEKMLYNQDIQ